MDRSIIMVLEEIQRKLPKLDVDEKHAAKYLKEVEFLKGEYETAEVKENKEDVYNSLVKKGRELTKESNIKDRKKVEFYLRYCHAVLYDLKWGLSPLNWIVRSYIITCILFLAIAPQYPEFLGRILPLVFIVPIYLGLKGMKKRSITGLYYALSVMPIGILTSAVVLRSTFLGTKLYGFNGYISGLAQQNGMALTTTRNLIITFTGLSVVLLTSALFTIYMAVKHRKMFV